MICRTCLAFDLFCLSLPAEREGFEPPEPRSSTVFKTAAIDHSAISPNQEIHEASLNDGANIRIFSKWTMQQDDRV